MTTEPRLSFSANGSGVILHTKYGGLNFNADEFSYYQSLFRVADNNNLGKLLLGGSQLNLLLIRSDISFINVEKAINITIGPVNEEPGFFLNTWLMLCKLLACHQETKKIPSEKLFKSLHTKAIRVPLAEFNLSNTNHEFSCGKMYKEYSVEVAGWKTYGEDYQHQHVKFRISTTSLLVNDSNLKCAVQEERIAVERRYSDFVAFASILHRNHQGLVIPPLPLKSWTFISPSADKQMDQRKQEFQLFLNDVTSHPVLKFSYELKCFLDSSSLGFKSFVELYTHVSSDGKVDYSGAHENLSGVSKILNDGASAVSEVGQAVSQTKAFGYISSLWGMVSKNVFAAAPLPVETAEDLTTFAGTTRMLEMVAKVGEHLQSLVTLETANSLELTKVAQNFKNMSEFEQIPDLVRTLQIAYEGLVDLGRSQGQFLDQQFMTAQTPVVYQGRFLQAYQSAIAQRTTAMDALRAAQAKEQEAKKSLHMLTESTRFSASSSPASTTFNEELLNQAKVDLANAEDSFEAAREREETVTSNLRSESRRLEGTHRSQLLANLAAFAQLRAASCHAELVQWQTLRDQLENKIG